ncbi:MAG TPA: PEP-utilizing enzyme, partial [Dehalococcoidia bacterium]|nr:PEP-utilizing enzyme [Dehalococcoidia bacterium]
MTATIRRIGEWDSDANPTFNLWTIGNASEVVPGISPPLFSTFGQRFEHNSAVQVAGRLNLLDVVPCYPAPTGNWAAVIAGRWALNIGWFNAAIGSWQVGRESGLMKQFISSTEGQDISAKASVDDERARRNDRAMRQLRGMLPRMVERDRVNVERLRAADRARDYTRISERAIWRYLERRAQTASGLLGHHLYVSLAAGDYTDRLMELLDVALPGHDPALIIALTSALREVESAKPAKGAWEVAQVVKRRKPLAEELRALAPHAIAERLRAPKNAGWRAFAAAFDTFIALYGFRGQGELDPSFADWEEEPAYAISFIKTYVEAGKEKDPYRLEERAAQGREALEAQILAAMPRQHRAVYRALLGEAQKFTRMREATKANWVRCDRLLRKPTLELGRRFVEGGLIKQRDDIFWLLVTEVEAAANGEAVAGLPHAPARRRKESERLAGLELPEVFALPVQPVPKAAVQAGATTLQGMPVSAGTASGPARVVLSAESAAEVELEPGEVLVAPFTDAPWTPLFVPAAAVVVETGGLLSHAATVARE